MLQRTLVLLFALSGCSCAGSVQTRAAPQRSDAPAPTQRPLAGAPQVERRVVISLGRPSGTSILQAEPDGALHTTLDVLENGRGPHVEASVRLAPDGTLLSFAAQGHHELGNTFTASFRRAGTRAQWHSTEESGQRELNGPAFFLPLAEVAEVDGWLVQAALRNGGTLPLLPAGEVRVERLEALQVEAHGTARTLIDYRVSGASLAPSHTWMNEDGSWFGTVSEWFSVLPEGWEPALLPMLAQQRAVDRTSSVRAYVELAHKPPATGVAFTHARVLDVERGRWLPDHTVLVRGDKITQVGPSSSIRVRAEMETLDLTGRALLPGLWDMHVHLGDADGPLDIASGVTTVRDVGNDPDKLDDYKQRFDSGEAIGPHVLRFGFIEGRNEKAASSTVTAETAAEARAAVQFFADRKYEGVKLYNSVRPELVPVIAEAAHARGLRVTGHVPVHMLAREAVAAGYDGIEHINMLFLNFFATHETDTRDTTRFTLVGERAPDLDLGSAAVRDFFALLARRKVVVTPTVVAFESVYMGEPGKLVAGLERMVARLPITTARGFLIGGLPMSDKQARYHAAFDKLLAMVKALQDAKVTLLTGTDDLPGLMLHRELELFVRAGIANADVLRMATLDAARSLGMADQVGSIAPGMRADLVVVDGDPLTRITDIERVVSTVRAGVLFDAAAVYRQVSVLPPVTTVP